MAEQKPATEQIVGLLFAPIGIVLACFDNLPKIKIPGPKELDKQVRSARMIGTFTVNQAVREVEKLLRVRPDQPKLAAPPIETIVVAPLPIASYDSMAAADIVKLLPGLSHDERDALAAHERAHRNRRTILGRIAQLNA